MVAIILYMLGGVNFPVDVLPRALQALSYALPMTRGIQAARLAIQGVSWPEVQFLIAGEMLIGLAYIVAGYLLFIWFEKLSLVDGQIEAM
jgi:ABC-2 type transport system permease protein